MTAVGAWRGHGLPVPALLGSGPEASGGYYSKAAIRGIVALAGRLGIDVIPEIDVPGHCYAMLQALPELRDPAETGSYFSVQGFPNNCLNPAREETFRVLETIFDELIELFPSKIIHIGADEVPLGAWSGSPEALARLRQIGGAAIADAHARRNNVVTNVHGADEIEGSGAALLQAEFLQRIQTFLASRGCITGGWQEAAHGNVIDKAKVYLNGWRSVEISAELAGQGYDMVVCPGQVYYLDMANSPAWSEPGAGWAGWSDPEKLYRFDPVEGWTEAQKRHFLGVQGCIWSEPMTDRGVFDRLVFPRLSALAETGWTRPEDKSWERFKALAGLMPVLYGALAGVIRCHCGGRCPDETGSEKDPDSGYLSFILQHVECGWFRKDRQRCGVQWPSAPIFSRSLALQRRRRPHYRWLLIGFFLQKSLLAGLSAGSVKG